jgi:subtilase family serine protease
VGTSFASPVLCGQLALAQQKLISLNSLTANSAGKQRFGRMQNVIYAQNGRTDVWYDVTSGSNGTLLTAINGVTTSSCTAKFDLVTGWGAMNIDAFVASQTVIQCPADLNGNRTVEGSDLGILLAYWGVAGAGDLNGDGVTNGADLGTMLAAWGNCP